MRSAVFDLSYKGLLRHGIMKIYILYIPPLNTEAYPQDLLSLEPWAVVKSALS